MTTFSKKEMQGLLDRLPEDGIIVVNDLENSSGDYHNIEEVTFAAVVVAPHLPEPWGKDDYRMTYQELTKPQREKAVSTDPEQAAKDAAYVDGFLQNPPDAPSTPEKVALVLRFSSEYRG